eukprot:TRINITY_DN15297_c0_g1_i3.p1 TRINITY_DN15297_c0_g1~~TRINITY_DN15297_c0_g1_i3.p1  ORF type:complete len:285 (+),score=39.19 TRINITY_DN15297_c0_g1_i3:412-1266(+)
MPARNMDVLHAPMSGCATATHSLVGYAGGRYTSPSGAVCYHTFPSLDYNKLGHAEAASITLDEITGPVAVAQLAALAENYFEHGFRSLSDGRRSRLDPQDAGPEYRNVIGIPGGMDNAELWPEIEAANTYGMPLIRGGGGPWSDRTDNFVVWVYDSREFPFYRGERYHQFHTNDVLGRPVPTSYTGALKAEQWRQGRLDDDLGCVELPFAELMFLFDFAAAYSFGLGCVLLYLLRDRFHAAYRYLVKRCRYHSKLPVSEGRRAKVVDDNFSKDMAVRPDDGQTE